MASTTNTTTGALDFAAGPLVWIDCEMTGLDPKKDKIIEIAVIITDGNLEQVDEGIEYIVNTEKDCSMDRMDAWCTKQHGKSGLTKACLESSHTREFVSNKVLEYVKKWIPKQRVGVLAGNSVHADKSFLVEEMPELTDWLHYRIVGALDMHQVASLQVD
ncbi:ribonuclease H-like domain-containing protein [Cyathus striatus]|nr:ribonuclease H-like domain-containing protein [Cyathus striatus]